MAAVRFSYHPQSVRPQLPNLSTLQLILLRVYSSLHLLLATCLLFSTSVLNLQKALSKILFNFS